MRGAGQEAARAGSGSRLLRQKSGSKLVIETKRWPYGRDGTQNQKAWLEGPTGGGSRLVVTVGQRVHVSWQEAQLAS